MKKKCKYKYVTSNRCGRWAMYVSKYCYGHNPKTKQARIVASKRRLKTQGYNPDLLLEEWDKFCGRASFGGGGYYRQTIV